MLSVNIKPLASTAKAGEVSDVFSSKTQKTEGVQRVRAAQRPKSFRRNVPTPSERFAPTSPALAVEESLRGYI